MPCQSLLKPAYHCFSDDPNKINAIDAKDKAPNIPPTEHDAVQPSKHESDDTEATITKGKAISMELMWNLLSMIDNMIDHRQLFQ